MTLGNRSIAFGTRGIRGTGGASGTAVTVFVASAAISALIASEAFADGVPAANSSSSAGSVVTDVAATAATAPGVAGEASTLQLAASHRAQRRAGSIHVDGKLDDGPWQKAARSRGFRQRFPKDGAAPAQSTEFALLYDDDAVYVGVWAQDSEPHLIKGLLTRRDQQSSSDTVMVAIDSYHDRRTAFAFGLNPSGVQRDMIIFDDTSSDDSWDAVWSGAASIGPEGWVAEFRIPLSQLRFSSSESQQWGLQVVRSVARTGEESSWSPWPRSSPEIVSRFGLVDGFERVRPGRRIELLPYATAGFGARPVDAGDPLNDSLTREGNLGLDAKLGLSSAFSLAATINPDFGQVEADPSQVNLGTAQLFFPEKRPFFLDGVELFKMGLGQGDDSRETLFYSRRIGAAPHGSASGDFVASPSSTTIYGATKISGKTDGGWSIGVLDAVTAEEQASFIDADGARGRQVVEPLTNFAVAKLKRDFREGKTTVAVAATSVHRALGDTELASELHDQAYTGGLEVFHRFWRERLSLSAKVMGSYVHGSKEAIAETQRLPRHLYQRPDAGHLTFDPARTSLVGAGLVADLSFRSANWRAATGIDLRSAGLEVNDLGFQDATDQFVHWAYGAYLDNDPGRDLLSYRINTNLYAASDLDPRLISVGGNVNANAQLVNHWVVGGGVELGRDRFSTRALRGGPALRQHDAAAMWAFLESDGRSRVAAGANVQVRTVPASASYRSQASLFARIQASSNLELIAEPGLSIEEDDAQYIDQVEGQDGATRYLVGRIRQTSASLTLRVAWTLTPRLSLQGYAQPFLATGGYEDYKEIADAGAVDPARRYHVLGGRDTTIMGDTIAVDRDGDGATDYSFERPDFGVRELRSTVVVRWE
ncbi:MAG: carbohydrate binding family 9 domain-containing protein [Myxococcales bacterium]|nr:carbohydrate binding family 9 domain-containing protein [Myxococcales bacterium]